MRPHLRPVILALAVLLAACGGPTSMADGSPAPSTPSATSVASASLEACALAARALGVFSQRMAGDLVALRPALVATPYVSTPVADTAYRISVTLSAYAGLDTTLADCPELAVLQDRTQSLLGASARAVSGVLYAQTADAQRGAAVVLFSVLPDISDLWNAAGAVAASAGLAVPSPDAASIGAAGIRWLPPLATLAPIPSSASWSATEYNSAALWQQSVLATFNSTLASLLWDLAARRGCASGASAADCSAARESGAVLVARAAGILGSHLALMDRRPAALCFADAYAADRTVVGGYQAWLSAWTPAAGTSDGRIQEQVLQQADADAAAFLARIGSFFADCA